MDKISYLNIILRLTIWFLLTADFSIPNIIIGLAIAFLIPGGKTHSGFLKDWLRVFWDIIKAIPQAYKEAVEIMLFPHNEEEIIREKVKPMRTPGLIFLDIFLITFTPKTIVLKERETGEYEVHAIRRKKRRR